MQDLDDWMRNLKVEKKGDVFYRFLSVEAELEKADFGRGWLQAERRLWSKRDQILVLLSWKPSQWIILHASYTVK